MENPTGYCHEKETETAKPHVAMFPSIGMGHLMPFLELAKKLVSFHSFTVTLITTTWNVTPVQTQYVQHVLASNPLTIRQLHLPPVSPDQEDVKSPGQNFISYINKSMGALEENLRILQEPDQPFSPVSALITDLFHAGSLDVTDPLGLPNYIFFTSSAALLCLMLYTPKLMEERQTWERDGDCFVYIPGMQPLRRADLPSPFHDTSSPLFHAFVSTWSRLQEVKGVLINTFHRLEPLSLHALMEPNVLQSKMPLVYTVGPIIRSSDLNADMDSWLEMESWLDKQPDASVVFVSFGSWGLLSEEQIKEIALGLEGSGQRFVWVVRGTISKTGAIADPSIPIPGPELNAILPHGFQLRVQERGLVVASWAPQIRILAHPAIGGFVSHCGWNSTLEAMWYGVPVLGWPLQAEQRMNCVFIVQQWKVGLEVQKRTDGMVGKEELQSAVKELIEGDEGRMARKNMEELSVRAREAVTQHQGSSFKSWEAALGALVKPCD